MLPMSCQFVRQLDPISHIKEIRGKIPGAKTVIGNIEKAVKPSDNSNNQTELKEAMLSIKALISLYEANKITAEDISVMKWLLVILCGLSVIQIGLIIKQINRIN